MTRLSLYHAAVLVAALNLWLTPPRTVIAQPIDELEQAEALTRAAVAQVNELIRRNGSGSLRDLAETVRFEVDRTTVPNAYAMRPRSGSRTIVISVQMTLLLFYFSELNLLNFKVGGDLSQCLIEYSGYVRRQYAELRTALLSGGTSQAIRSPERYAAQTEIACGELLELYPILLTDRPQRDAGVMQGVAFVYLHELGHHARQHVIEHEPDLDRMPDELSRRRAFLGYMCRSRAMELEADAFAADTVVDIGDPNMVWSTALWSALTATGGIDPALEQIETHPTGTTRMAFVLDRVRARLEAKGQPTQAEINTLIDDTVEFVDKIERMLPTMPLPDGSSYICR